VCVLAACGLAARHAVPALPADRTAIVRYVALGDSTVEGVGASAVDRTYVSQLHARLRSIYPRAQVANLELGGATSDDVVAAQLDRAVAVAPDLVTLSVGPNDITKGVPLERFERNVRTIFRTLREGTRAVVVATLLPDLVVTPRYHRHPEREKIAALVVAFNEALARQAEIHGVVIVDLYAASRTEVPQRPELVGDDGYHPSDAGYARWAELMWERLAPLTAAR
jgi:acyl-CoA thioesterase-1